MVGGEGGVEGRRRRGMAKGEGTAQNEFCQMGYRARGRPCSCTPDWQAADPLHALCVGWGDSHRSHCGNSRTNVGDSIVSQPLAKMDGSVHLRTSKLPHHFIAHRLTPQRTAQQPPPRFSHEF